MTAPSREELTQIIGEVFRLRSANPQVCRAADAILARIGGEREADQKRIAELEERLGNSMPIAGGGE